jgi:hypothetical protein
MFVGGATVGFALLLRLVLKKTLLNQVLRFPG